MSARARARIAIETAEELAREEAERAEMERAQEEEDRAAFEAGPPDGCRECYAWVPDFMYPGHRWGHVCEGEHVIVADDGCGYVCNHECHGGEPYGCTPVAIAGGRG